MVKRRSQKKSSRRVLKNKSKRRQSLKKKSKSKRRRSFKNKRRSRRRSRKRVLKGGSSSRMAAFEHLYPSKASRDGRKKVDNTTVKPELQRPRRAEVASPISKADWLR